MSQDFFIFSQEIYDENSIENASQNSSENASQSSSAIQNQKKSKIISQESVEFEIIEGKRQGCKLLHSITEKQLYVKNKKLVDGSIAYTCHTKNCKARVFLVDENCFLSSPFVGHSHGNKENEINELKVFSKIKADCASPLVSQTTSQISEVREIFDGTMLRSVL